MQYRFDDLFTINVNDSITPKVTVRIGAATFGPSITFRKGVYFSGVDIFEFLGCSIEADEENGVYDIKGFYK